MPVRPTTGKRRISPVVGLDQAGGFGHFRQIGLRPCADVGDDLSGSQRAEAGASCHVLAGGEAIQEAGGIEIAGAGRVDNLIHLCGFDHVHFVASDCHNMSARPPGLCEAREVVAKRYGAERAQRLFEDNPRALLDNKKLGAAA